MNACKTRSMCDWSGLRRRDFPFLFVGVRGMHTHEVDSPSFFNISEAEKIAELIEKLLGTEMRGGGTVSTNDVAVVTPFRMQVIESPPAGPCRMRQQALLTWQGLTRPYPFCSGRC